MAPERTEPSGDEVRRRLASLYDRAEDDTGNFNATRALAGLSSRQGDRRAVARRLTDQGPAVEQRGGADAAQSDLMRQWFDGARSRLGPTVAAVLPVDRQPDRGRGTARSGGGAGRPMELPAQDVRAVAELTAAPVRELTAGPVAAPVAELTARPVLELTAGPVSGPTTGRGLAVPDGGAPATGPLPVVSGPTPAADASSPRFRKDRARRKLAAAQDLLTRHNARRSVAAPVAYPPLELPPAETAAPADPYWPARNAQIPAATAAYPSVAGAAWPAVEAGHPQVESAPLPVAAVEYLPPQEMWSAPAQPVAPALDDSRYPSWPEPVNQPAPGAPWSADPNPGYDTGSIPALAVPPVTGYDTGSMAAVAVPSVAGYDTGSMAAVAVPSVAGYDTGSMAAVAVPPVAGYDTGSMAAVAVPPVAGYDTRAAEAVAFARAQVGRPCVWGASGPGSYDPSGLTQAAWRSAGVLLPRSTSDQARIGPAVALAGVQPGDLIFFHGDLSHVGLYVGDGMMVHAPSPGGRITEESVQHAGQAAIHSVVRPV
ncbi:NlpC/P60 family protein [Streptomyces sp. NBC_00687]|uniref:C40 family peptidase n=1 Tax=Streptomyces sp. NBC_00687 TaxID=2975807 RepID=UPI002B1DC865|nr:NlpC/P60 family protein [Streptomyces sp. NBC_00687]